jgi:hypothetical protein
MKRLLILLTLLSINSYASAQRSMPRGRPPATKEENYLSMAIFLIMLGATIYYLILKDLKDNTYHTELFSKSYRSSKKNVRFAYKTIGFFMVYAENDDLRGQIKYLVAYLRNIFPESRNFDMQEFMQIRHELDGITAPVRWLRNILPKDHYPQVIDFMIDLAYYNGRVSRRELHLIYHAGKVLGLPVNEIQSILTMRQNHYKEQERAKRERQSAFASTLNRSTKKNSSLRILGLPNTTTDLMEVRKAYRDLARKYHPDRFVNLEKGEQQMAHERFVQINNAHDYLQSIMR